jgi:NADH:ubiquinone oxidoreductase subunit E
LAIAEKDRAVQEIIDRHLGLEGNLLPILHAIQSELGHLPELAMVRVARSLGIPLSKVYGTATFYSLFTTHPKGEYVIRICESAPCHIQGAQEVIKALEKELGVKVGETTPDQKFTLELASCIGVCGVAPAIMINEHVHGNLTPSMIPGIIARYRRGLEAPGLSVGQESSGDRTGQPAPGFRPAVGEV